MPSSKKGIQGPRPNPLRIVKDLQKAANKRPAAAAESSPSRPPPPTIVYEHTPKVVHASPQEFRGVVQQLTGRSSTPDHHSGRGFFRADDHQKEVDNGSSDHDDDRAGIGSMDDSMLLLTLGRRQSLEIKGSSSSSASPPGLDQFSSPSAVKNSFQK